MGSRSGDGKKNSIVTFLALGTIVLSICLGVCIFIVSMLRTQFTVVVARGFQERHISIGQSIDSDFWADINLAKSGASTLADTRYTLSRERIFNILDDYCEHADIDHAAFIYNSSMFYNGGVYSKETTDDSIKGLWDVLDGNGSSEYVEIGDFVSDGEVTVNSKNELMIVEPVISDSEYKGSFITVRNLDEFFNDSMFEFQNSICDGYLIDIHGNILLTGGNSRFSSQDEDFTIAALKYSDGRPDSKNLVQKLINDINSNTNDYVSITTSNGDNLQISYYSLNSVGNVAFISCYNDNLVLDRIHPTIFRLAMACMAIIVLMLIIILYVWATGKKASITIEKLAYEDSVTGGKNINYFKDFAVETMSVFKETPFLIYRFDIVNFRYINEAYGHKRADEILKSCIKNFEEVFSDKELCVRMNADQFLALVVNEKTLDQCWDQYKKMVNADARSGGIKYPIRFKIGIYQIRKNEHNIDVMIDHANVARKTISDTHQAVAFYTENVITDMRKIDRVESDMQRALANGEFKVYYQPKWDIVHDHVAGAEALVRWIKADNTMVYPDEFIPIFEQNGFIEKLDFYILETVCSQMHDLLEEGHEVYPVSVNQSRLLLHSPDYVDNVAKIIKKYNIPQGGIELEITETVFQDDRDNMIETMKELNALGVKISMDDFGSGYSSLNMLKDAPFAIIKIDREFFSESITSEVTMWILQKIIEMVNGLGMEVICEGVETGEQSMLLKSIGCRMVQGYFYSKPIPFDVYVERYCPINYVNK